MNKKMRCPTNKAELYGATDVSYRDWLLRAAIAVLLSVTLTLSLTSCQAKSDEELIADRMNSFADAYNSADLSGMVDCFDSQTRRLFSTAIDIGKGLGFGDIYGIDTATVFGAVLGYAHSQYGDESYMKIDIVNTTFQSDTSCIVEISIQGYSSPEDFSIQLIKEGSDWYLDGSCIDLF